MHRKLIHLKKVTTRNSGPLRAEISIAAKELT